MWCKEARYQTHELELIVEIAYHYDKKKEQTRKEIKHVIDTKGENVAIRCKSWLKQGD